MFGFIKKVFFTGLTILSSINLLTVWLHYDVFQRLIKNVK